MTTETIRLEVDIGTALVALGKSPELCAAMNGMVGGRGGETIGATGFVRLTDLSNC